MGCEGCPPRHRPYAGQTSIREPTISVRSRGRQKDSAPSVRSLDVALKRFLRHTGLVGSPPFVSSIFDKKNQASSLATNPSGFVGPSGPNVSRPACPSLYPRTPA